MGSLLEVAAVIKTASTPTPFEISKVVPGKIMDKAGLKLYDQVQFRNVNDLYRLLIENQGNEVVIPIIRDKRKMMIRVSVPELDVPLADVSFLL